MQHKPEELVPLIPVLTRRARRLSRTPAEAEDLVQDTLLSVVHRMDQGARITDLEAYTMRSLGNRARRRWRAPETEELHEDSAQTAPVAPLRLDCADTLAAVAQLPTPQRQLMELVIAGETSPRALACATGLPLGTVMSRLARARARLRITLQDDAAQTPNS